MDLSNGIPELVDLVLEGLGDEIERNWIGGTFIICHRKTPIVSHKVAGLKRHDAEE